MRYKNDKQYQICHYQIRFFFKLKMHQNLFSAGVPPRTPHYPPRSTLELGSLGSQAPSIQNPGYASGIRPTLQKLNVQLSASEVIRHAGAI